jgi:hypothetical protein
MERRFVDPEAEDARDGPRIDGIAIFVSARPGGFG